MQNYILEILEKNNISTERYLDCKPRAIAGFVASSRTIASRILPKSLNLITEDEEASKTAIVERLVNDSAYSQAILRAVASYVKLAFEDKIAEFDTASVQGFYDTYKEMTPEAQRAEIITTGRMCNDLLDVELERAASKDSDLAQSLKEGEVREGEFDAFLLKITDAEDAMVMYQMSDLYKFASMMAVSLINFHEVRGKSLEESRDANRSTGFIINAIYEQISNTITGDILRTSLKRDLPERDFNIVEALVLSETIESSQSVH